MADENKTNGAAAAARDNKYDGVYGECPPHAQINLSAIGPNDPRPAETTATRWVAPGIHD